MAVLKEFRCMAHGPFEGFDPTCPRGCSPRMVKREFRTAPAFQNKKTRFVDAQLRGIAADAGLTNLKNDPKSGTSVMQELRKGKGAQKSNWLGIEHAKPGFSQRKESAPVFDPRASGFTPPDKPIIRPGAMPPLRPRIVGRYDGK